jgi:hypothetical protein
MKPVCTLCNREIDPDLDLNGFVDAEHGWVHTSCSYSKYLEEKDKADPRHKESYWKEKTE